MGQVADRIRARLTAAFAPQSLEIVDDSERHRGHSGWREGGETHFRVSMRAAAFDGVGRVERQRAVNRVLADELAGPVHALQLDLRGAAE